ncbi:MAG: long-chain fatty acid--CoA ligase [Muribaculaceae bacterium]|nr:long-chain fatty acid--CoA ligase [Muribaculaceae bacterium]
MANKLVELISSQAAKYGNREVFRHKSYDTKDWITTSWDQFAKEVKEAALAFEILGIKEKDNIAIFSHNCPEILITHFAAFYNRAVPVPMYATSSKSQVEYIVRDASISTVFVGDQGQYAIAREAMCDCKIIKQLVAYNQPIIFDSDDKTSITFNQLLELGENAGDNIKNEVERRMAAGVPEDLACLIYTSGTTGEPKGVMLNHSNFDAQMINHLKRLDTISEKDVSMCFLPLSHIFECAWAYFCLYKGMRMAINYNPKEIQTTIKEINPTIMCSVPRFWEKVYTAVEEKVATMSPIQRRLVRHALNIGKWRNLKFKRKGLKAPFWLEWQYRIFDKAIYSTLRRAIGIEHGVLFPTAGAALCDHITEFLHSCGINIVIGYGLSETTATVSCFPTSKYRIGTIGTLLDGIQVRIGDDNEILVKGETVMKGYYNKPEETAKVFTDDGYFKTGDAGKFDADGNLIMTERLKDLFKTSNGKYIAPQALESRLGGDKYIEQVAIIGDQRKYVTAIIIPAYEALKEYAASKKIKYQNIDDLVKNTDIYKMIESRINDIQKNMAGFEQIKRFTLLPKAFSMETGELTNTLKIRRSIINKLYRKEIDAMYA